LGAKLAVVGTAQTREEGIKMVEQLMGEANVKADHVNRYAEKIYDAVTEFIQNTGFCVPVYRPKY
jgi:hypothetical protein